MPSYSQADRPIAVYTPLATDALLLIGFKGEEGISRLFNFQLELLCDTGDIDFDKLLGGSITISVALPGDKHRYINGICRRVLQGMRGEIFTQYSMEIVPQLWLLTKRAKSRIFQHKTVPQILEQVLAGLNVSFKIRGTYEERDYCVQYRETDFDFASRLMEEEGIYYFFTHKDDGHQMVVSDSSINHPDMPDGDEIIFEDVEGGLRDEQRIYRWQRVQELRTVNFTLWDHNFQVPDKNLEATEAIQPKVTMGRVEHSLRAGGNLLEVYDYPGDYAKRYNTQVSGLIVDKDRTANLRAEAEAVGGVFSEGESNCGQLVSGHTFKLKRHTNADGDYVLTSLKHEAKAMIDFRSGEDHAFEYRNSFTCIPHSLRFPFRPQRTTPKPVVRGSQTALVVGPLGEEIYVDQYGRVKVQFFWDRDGHYDSDSSCWIRVAQGWAGKRWGSFFLPRVGMEVIVDFLEGDPDRPIITGCVYNASEVPHYKLPDYKTMSYVKSYSTTGGEGFNEIRFDDKKGQEQVFIHAEKNKDVRIKHNRYETVGNDSHFIVTHDQFEQVGGDKHQHVKGEQNEKVDGAISRAAGSDIQEKAGQKYALDAGTEIHLKSALNLVLETGVSLTLKVGSNFININTAGIFISGSVVMINSGGAAGSGAGSHPQAPADPIEADKATPGQEPAVPEARPRPEVVSYSSAALALHKAAQSGAPFCEICARAAAKQ